MNGAVHYLSSVILTLIICKLFTSEKNKDNNQPLLWVTIFVVNFFFHTIMDSFAKGTYHPSISNWGDPFYASWHIFTYIAEFGISIYILRKDLRYSIGMVGAIAFDLWDWSIVRFLDKYAGIELLGLHFMADWVQNSFFTWLPNLRETKWAAIFEILWGIALFIIWRNLARYQNKLEEKSSKPKYIVILILFFGIWRVMALF